MQQDPVNTPRENGDERVDQPSIGGGRGRRIHTRAENRGTRLYIKRIVVSLGLNPMTLISTGFKVCQENLWVVCLCLAMLTACTSPGATSTSPKAIAKRRLEKAVTFEALPTEFQEAVNQGHIRVGMNYDAVYIAWGKPAQILQGGDASGEHTTWLYHGTATDSFHTWRYREYPRKDGTTFLDRTLDTDYAFRDYVSAELSFQNGLLQRWKMLPKPPEGNYYAPGPY